ncbi:MAG: hypothetical protein ACK5V7_12630, partial [bacterium]
MDDDLLLMRITSVRARTALAGPCVEARCDRSLQFFWTVLCRSAGSTGKSAFQLRDLRRIKQPGTMTVEQ